jgi:hypothetical protein
LRDGDFREAFSDARYLFKRSSATDYCLPIIGAPQNIVDEDLIAVLNHKVEEAEAVQRKRSSMGSSDYSEGFLAAKKLC